MCQFLSCISDGSGKVLYFTPEQVAGDMAKGNPQSYDWNSHTSIAHFNNILGDDEDKWNKWEYNPTTKILKKDTLNTTDDYAQVIKVVKKFLKDKDVAWLMNIYNHNTGYRNTGYHNTGDHNTGDHNTGGYNTGGYNTGGYNTGYRNTGNHNTGGYNTGGYNTGNYNTGWFNTNEPTVRMFNKDTGMKIGDVKLPSISLPLVEWISSNSMTRMEKRNFSNHKTIGGYLKVLDYKKAWKEFWNKTSKANKKLIFNLPNFDKKIFAEITGIKVTKKELRTN